MFRLGYNTNGLAHHRLDDALRLLADLGYEGCAITLDVGQLDPFRLRAGEVERTRALADDLGLALAVETGARYLLDPARKHRPTLLEDDPHARGLRIDFLRRALDVAADLGAAPVSIWSGAPPEGGPAGDDPAAPSTPRREELWERLRAGVAEALEHAARAGVPLAFEPEPGMFVERPAGYAELVRRLGAVGAELGLCLDVGHLLCTGDRPEADVVRRLAPQLAHVHLDDIAGGVHEHRMLGEGDLDLPGVLQALLGVGFTGMAAVELSRDGHRGPAAAAEALLRVREALEGRSGLSRA